MSELLNSILEDEVIRILQATPGELTATQVAELITSQNAFTIKTDSAFNQVWVFIDRMIDAGQIIRYPDRTLKLRERP